MIDLQMMNDRLERSVARARERKISIPTFAQMKDPDLIPSEIREELQSVGLWDVNPINLYRISWKNQPKIPGGSF